MKRALLITAALTAVAAAPAGAKRAYFKLDVRASQHVTWSADSLTKGCSNSVTELHATGTGDLKAQDKYQPWALAQHTNDGRRITLLVDNAVPSSFAVSGTYARTWKQNAFFTKAPDDPSGCPKSLPGSPDCGTRALPMGALMYVNYVAPGAWTYPPPKPKGGMLTLSGPYVEDWVGMPPFQICGGANGDDTLAGSWYDTSMRPLAAPLSPSKLFGKARRFTVRFREERTVQTGHPGGAVLEDDHPVTTAIHWKVTFTRTGPQLQTPDL